MKRKKITVSFDELPGKIKKQLVSFFKRKDVNLDPKTISITAYEIYQYTPKTYELFIQRLERYVSINGNREVRVTELSTISKISRPTINKMRKSGLIPSVKEVKDKEFHTLFEKQDYLGALSINTYYDDKYHYNLQDVINYFYTLHSEQNEVLSV